MARKTAKSKSIVQQLTIDLTKPILKEFVDKKDILMRYIETMLPHMPNTKMRAVHLHSSKDKLMSRYRINYYLETFNGLATQRKITASKYIQIEHTESGLKLTDMTKGHN